MGGNGNKDGGGGVQLKNKQGTGEESKGKCQGVELTGKVVPRQEKSLTKIPQAF